jgi:ribosomal protein RSM22 (predicted rRNA methylase)
VIGRLPEPLDATWVDTLREVSKRLRLAPFDDQRLPQHIAAMAAIYNDERLAGLRGSRDQLAARLHFWFPRDVPKVAGAVRELVAMGRLRGPLKVLDLGAGLGASHRGLARALDSGAVLDVLAVDDDREALRIASAIYESRPREGSVEIRLRTEERSITDRPPRGRFDVVLISQVISELDLDRKEDERVELHSERIATLARESLEPNGVIVVVEPALRTRTRHLQRIRGAAIGKGLQVIAPCLHHERCPLLGREGDWCHEDLPVDLPEFLVPLAKRAGLRWEGLTFSYLLLARSTPRLVDRLAPGDRRERAVSGLLVSKGKSEIVLCGDPLRGEVPPDDLLGPRGARIGRLDRARSAQNERFDELQRGDIVTVGPLDDKLRVGPDGCVRDVPLTDENSEGSSKISRNDVPGGDDP